MRSAEETLSLFKQVMEQRRNYVRHKYGSIEIVGREHQPRYEQALRGGMLSELSTMSAVLQMIEKGEKDPLEYWSEWRERQVLPQAIVRQNQLNEVEAEG